MDEQPEPHALAMILVAELHKIGMFDQGNLASIPRRIFNDDDCC